MTRDHSVNIMANRSSNAKYGDWIWNAYPDLQQGLSEWEMQEIVLRANRKFQEVAKESAASTGDAAIEKIVLERHLAPIVDKVREDSSKMIQVYDAASNSVLYGYMDTALSRGHGMTRLGKEEKDDLLKKFKNYGTSIGYIGGTRNKVKNIARDAGFAFEKGDSFRITSNEKDKNLVEMTFNGNCQNAAYHDIGNNCFVGVAYNSVTGNVTIVPDKVFHRVKGEDGKDYLEPIDLKKTGGWFGKSDLEKTLGSRSAAKDVQKSFKSLKLIACSNPPRVEGLKDEDQPKRCADVMVNGKTRGASLSFYGKLALAACVATVAVAAIATGFGITLGAGMLLGAGALVTSAVTTGASGAVGASSIVYNSSVGAGINAAGAETGKILTQSYNFLGKTSAQSIAATSAVGTTVLGATAVTAKSVAAGLASGATTGTAGAVTSAAKMAAVQAGNGIVLGGEAAMSSMVKVVGNGAFAVESFVASNTSASGANSTLNSVGRGLGYTANVIGSGIQNTASAVGRGFGPAANVVGNGVQNAANAAGQGFGNLDNVMGNGITNSAMVAGNAIQNSAIAAGNALGPAANVAGNGAQQAAIRAGEGIQNVAASVGNGLGTTDAVVGNGIENAAVNAGEGAQRAVNVVGDGVSNVVNSAVGAVPQSTIGSATVGTTQASIPLPIVRS